MYTNQLFTKFIKERNIKKSTENGYKTALQSYTKYHKKTLQELINEANTDEEKQIPLKNRKLKQRLLDYRTHLLKNTDSKNTIKTYFTKIKTFYKHYEIEIPTLPDYKIEKIYETNYLDLPTKEHIKQAIQISTIDFKSLILFMSSSGTAKAETLSITIKDFLQATQEYYPEHLTNITEILNHLSKQKNIIPTFYLKRIKTNKFYYTFCSSEATREIIKYLKTRKNLTLEDKLFPYTQAQLLHKFQEINDKMEWGFKGKYRFFRSHTLRKYHASNIGLEAEYIDELQGRGKSDIHNRYIKTNPKRLKEIYKTGMPNVMINIHEEEYDTTQEFTIVINVFLSGAEYNII